MSNHANYANHAKRDKKTHRLNLMLDLCTNAHHIALEGRDRSDAPDMLQVFELALRDCLTHNDYNKDDLASVWAMLELGSRAIRNVSRSTEDFNLGTSSNTLTPTQDPLDGRNSR